jgi:hypothetical protein
MEVKQAWENYRDRVSGLLFGAGRHKDCQLKSQCRIFSAELLVIFIK